LFAVVVVLLVTDAAAAVVVVPAVTTRSDEDDGFSDNVLPLLFLLTFLVDFLFCVVENSNVCTLRALVVVVVMGTVNTHAFVDGNDNNRTLQQLHIHITRPRIDMVTRYRLLELCGVHDDTTRTIM
jgi:hypothetical protein